MTKTEHQTRVKQFMEMAGQTLPESPTVPDEKTRILRAKLIFEEALETLSDGLGITVYDIGNKVPLKMENLEFELSGDFDIVETVDGCADISVVTVGTLLAIGVDDVEVLEEVDVSNLSKFREGYRIREDGKVIKSPLYQEAKFNEVIARQRDKTCQM